MLKRRVLPLLLCLLLLLSLAPQVLADADSPTYVYDLSGKLTAAEQETLNDKAQEIAARYSFAPYIVIVDDHSEYSSEATDSTAAQDVYEYNEFGYGNGKYGSILLICLKDEAYGLYVSFDPATDATLADGNEQRLIGAFLPMLEAGYWEASFSAYLETTEALLTEGNTPASTDEPARGDGEPPAESGSTQYVYDVYGLLTEDQRSALQKKGEDIAAEYHFGVYLVVVDDFYDYSGKRNVEDAAEVIFTNADLGYGDNRDGLMLLLSMDERDYDICAHGYGHYAFTDYGKEQLAGEFKDNFRRDDWYGGASDYFDGARELLRRAANGNPLDVSGGGSRASRERSLGQCVVVGLGVGLAAALIVTLSMRRKLKSVKKARGAADYTVPGSLNLTSATDFFTHTTETRVKIESDSSSGGGGTHISSGGFSHSSGKF